MLYAPYPLVIGKSYGELKESTHFPMPNLGLTKKGVQDEKIQMRRASNFRLFEYGEATNQ